MRCIYLECIRFAGGNFRVLSRGPGRLWRRDCGAQRPRPHVREEDRLGDVKAVEEMLQQVSDNAFIIPIKISVSISMVWEAKVGLHMVIAGGRISGC